MERFVAVPIAGEASMRVTTSSPASWKHSMVSGKQKVFGVIWFGPLGKWPCAPVRLADSDPTSVLNSGIQGRQGPWQAAPDEAGTKTYRGVVTLVSGQDVPSVRANELDELVQAGFMRSTPRRGIELFGLLNARDMTTKGPGEDRRWASTAGSDVQHV
jgi:hypothetical protein